MSDFRATHAEAKRSSSPTLTLPIPGSRSAIGSRQCDLLEIRGAAVDLESCTERRALIDYDTVHHVL